MGNDVPLEILQIRIGFDFPVTVILDFMGFVSSLALLCAGLADGERPLKISLTAG